MKELIRRISAVLSAALFVGLFGCIGVSAEDPYKNYIYDHKQEKKNEPQAYIPYTVLEGETWGIQGLETPADLFVAPDGEVYIADTGNDRILVLSPELSLKRELKGIWDGETLVPVSHGHICDREGICLRGGFRQQEYLYPAGGRHPYPDGLPPGKRAS